MNSNKIATAVESSQNRKTGAVSATYASMESCSDSCPLKEKICYGKFGLVGCTTSRLGKATDALPESEKTPEKIAEFEASEIDKLTGKKNLRVHVVGDCKTSSAAKIISAAMKRFRAKFGKLAWTYTHSWRNVARSCWGNESILASVETIADAKKAMAKGFAAAITVIQFQSQKMYTVDGVKLLPCLEQTKGLTCVECKLCLSADKLLAKGIVIAFALHGSGAKAGKMKLEMI